MTQQETKCSLSLGIYKGIHSVNNFVCYRSISYLIYQRRSTRVGPSWSQTCTVTCSHCTRSLNSELKKINHQGRPSNQRVDSSSLGQLFICNHLWAVVRLLSGATLSFHVSGPAAILTEKVGIFVFYFQHFCLKNTSSQCNTQNVAM